MSKIERKLNVQLKNGLKFMVYVHDITSVSVEAIVNPANEDLSNTGGCACIISTAAGPTFESDCMEIIQKKKKVKVTENEKSGPGKLPFKCIINAVGPQWESYDDNHKIRCLEDLYLTIWKVFDRSEKEKIKSVAIPPISSGIFGVPKELCAPMYVQAIIDFDFMKKTFPKEVHIVDLSDEILDLTCKAYQSFREDPKMIQPKAILKNYKIFTKEITTKQKMSKIKRKLNVQLKNGLKFMVYVHDITSVSVEAIVNPANEDLSNTGGCACIISTAAGPTFESDCMEIIQKKKKVKVTENEKSGPGKLPFKCIINAVGPQWESYDDNHKIRCLEDLYLTIWKVFDRSEKEKIKSVAIPPISSGIFGVPKELCAPMYVQAIIDFDFMKKTFPKEVHIVDLSDEILDLTCKAYQSFREDPKMIQPKAILKNYEIFTKEITTKQTKSSDKYPEQNPCRLFKNDGEKAIFEMGSGVKIFIYRDDLVMLEGIGTLVSAENSAFTGNGALAQSILQRAGPSYEKHHYQVQLDSRKKRFSKGSTIALDAGKLDYSFVIHAIVSRFSEDVDRKKDELVDLKITACKVLSHADFLCTSQKKSKNLEKIAMPLLGAGDIRNPRILELLCSYVYQGIKDFFRYPSALKEVHLVSFNEETHRAFTKVFLDVSANDFLGSKNYPPSNLPSLRNTDDNRDAANVSSAVWKTEESTLVNWYDIHHKTKPTEVSEGKVDKSDRGYLHCVEELENIGITVSKTERERTEKIMNTGML